MPKPRSSSVVAGAQAGNVVSAASLIGAPGFPPKLEETTSAPANEVRTVVKPVQNAIAILRHLSRTGEASTVTQLSRMLGINISTCFNILRTLSGEDMVAFDPVAKTYKTGMGVLQLVSNMMSEDNRLAAARPHLQQFAKQHNVTVCVWRRMSVDRNLLVAVEHARGAVRIHLQLGQSLPVLLGSTGRVMLPHLGLDRAQSRAEFKKLSWFNAPSFDDYYRDAMESSSRGWAKDDGNFSAGVLTVSAPILNLSNSINYSLTALAFRDQYGGGMADHLGEELVRLAKDLRPILA